MSSTGVYRSGARIARVVPLRPLIRGAETIGSVIGRRRSPKRDALRENLSVVCPGADEAHLDMLVRHGYASYARYWAETLRMPWIDGDTLSRGLRASGYDHIRRARAQGHGPILVLPHLGGWEWAAAYLGRVANVPVTAVVERVEPPELFEWFRALRMSYGIQVVPLGSGAVPTLIEAVRQRHVVCLLADRDIGGGGIEVQFFGRSTTLPAGPALIARRTGAPLLPTAVYFARNDGQPRWLGHHCHIDPPIEMASTGSLRQDVAITTQRIAHRLERLIERAPHQWHVLERRFG